MSALSRDHDRLEQLRKEHPDWQIWNVPRVKGPTTWHAEPARYPLDADSPDHLAEAIAHDEAPPGEGQLRARRLPDGGAHRPSGNTGRAAPGTGGHD